MGHYCGICGYSKPNEQFSGKGHRNHVCKKCQKMPKAKRQEIRDRDFVWSVLEQSNISKGNRANLERIAKTYADELGERAMVVLEVAKVKSHKGRRIKWLRENRRDLFDEMVRLGFFYIVDADGEMLEEEWQ